MAQPDRHIAVLGATTAFALDVAVLVVARVLASSVPVLTFLFLAALPGLAVAPLLGWRFGPRALDSNPEWVGRAILEVVAATTVAWVVYVVGFFLILGAPGPPGSDAVFVLYALLSGIAYAIIPAVVAVVPFGVVWRTIVRGLAGRAAVDASRRE